MAATFVDIRNYLKTKLEAVPLNTKIEKVYKAQVNNIEGYPAACIFPSENIGDYGTTAENIRQYIIYIRLYQEMQTRPEEQVDDIMSDLVDLVIEELDKDYKLGNNVAFCNATPSTWAYEDADIGRIRVATIKVVAKELISIV